MTSATWWSYAFAAQYPDRVTRWVAMDALLPGIGPWDEILRSPALWHFNFWGPDAERLVEGRERIYLDRFWNELSATPNSIDEATRQHYAALYARPGAIHSAFNQFAAFTQDAIDNKVFAGKLKLTPPTYPPPSSQTRGTGLWKGSQQPRLRRSRHSSTGSKVEVNGATVSKRTLAASGSR